MRICIVVALACLFAVPAHADTISSVWLIVAKGEGVPGRFGRYPGGGEDPGPQPPDVQGPEFYQIYHYADVMTGEFPGPYTFNVMSDIPEGSFTPGSEFMYFGHLPTGHLGVSSPNGPAAPIDQLFEKAALGGFANMDLLNPMLGALGGTAAVSADEFWNHIAAFQEGGENPRGFFSAEEMADFVNFRSGGAGIINFNAINEGGLVFGINEDDFAGFTDPVLFARVRTVIEVDENNNVVINKDGGGAIVPAPEPASLALLGVAGMALLARRRRRDAA